MLDYTGDLVNPHERALRYYAKLHPGDKRFQHNVVVKYNGDQYYFSSAFCKVWCDSNAAWIVCFTKNDGVHVWRQDTDLFIEESSPVVIGEIK
jgi:hypothetical protein